MESASDASVVFVDIDNKQAIDNEMLSESDSLESDSDESSVDCVHGDDPLLYEELCQIPLRYNPGKRIQADEGDAQGIPCPHPEVVGVQVQNLHRVMPGINRFFICRQQECTPAGSFFGLNTDWISTVDAGRCKFACPACGTPYNRNLSKLGLIPANHIWHIETTGEFMLAEWPETLEEKSINEAAVKMAEHAADVHFTDLSHEELQLKIGEVVAKHGVKLAGFTTMQLSPAVISNVTTLNAHRGTSLPLQLGPHQGRLHRGLLQVHQGRDPRHEV